MSDDDSRGWMRQIAQAFRLQGLQVTSEVLRDIINVIRYEKNPSAAVEDIIIAIKAKMERKELLSTVVDNEAWAAVARDLTNTEDDLERLSLAVINAFEGRRLVYEPTRKQLKLETAAQCGAQLHGEPAAKGAMMRERLMLMQQRVARHELFRPPVIATSKRDYLKVRGALPRHESLVFSAVTTCARTCCTPVHHMLGSERRFISHVHA
jgi:hypothetical protein